MNTNNWLLYYLNWKLDLIHDLGFGFDLNSNEFQNLKNIKILNIKVDNIEYNIPTFYSSEI